ncbi:MAG: hypothetical protein MUP16_11090 [Sedimentisphaerales bacterium]|nr:hypothetical protein [Sedimentisphaerales bacterium]
MQVKVDNEHEIELVSFCGFSFGQFMQFAEFLSFARLRGQGHVEEIATELCLSCHWAIDWAGKTMALLDLTWEQIFMLNSILVLDDNRNSFIWIHKAIEKAVDIAMSAKGGVNREVLIGKF